MTARRRAAHPPSAGTAQQPAAPFGLTWPGGLRRICAPTP